MSSSPDASHVCLTFDDGPDPLWTPLILDALSCAGARATFFVITPLARANPRIIDRIIESGHEVALHCSRHIRHSELTSDEILADVSQGLGDLSRLGVEPKSWRPPWGIVTDDTRRIAQITGLRLVSWTADTHDWRGDPADSMLREVTKGLSGGSIVLMHDGIGPGATREGCHETLALISPLIKVAETAGLRTATTSELREATERHSPRGDLTSTG